MVLLTTTVIMTLVGLTQRTYRGYVYIGDPVLGHKKMGLSEFSKGWNGIVFALIGGHYVGLGAMMLDGVKTQQPLAVAVQHRRGRDHLGIEQRPAAQRPMKRPAVAVGPVHHGGD